MDGILGAIARPARVHFVVGLPKTRSGKMLRRSLQALAEGRDPGDLTTLDDPSRLENIKKLLGRWPHSVAPSQPAPRRGFFLGVPCSGS